MDEVFEGLVREGMARMRWSRKRAEQAARRYLKREGNAEKAQRMLGRVRPRSAGPTKRKAVPRRRLLKAGEAAAIAPKQLDVEEVLAMKEAAKKRPRIKAKRPLKSKPKKRQAAKKLTKEPELVGDLAAQTKPKKPKAKKRPLTPAQRLRRAVGPDDGRRRGGSPFLQGGSPSLGRRR